MKVANLQNDVGKVAGEWYCPKCFIQNNLNEEKCTACGEEKNEFYVVRTLSTSQKSKLKAQQNNQKALSKIANRSPDVNIISHVCEWDWVYCDGIICQDPNYNRNVDIMEDLVESETYDEKSKSEVSVVITDLPFDEALLAQSLILVGLFPQTFRSDDDETKSQPSTPKVKRMKKKEVGLKQINNILQRREDNKEKEKAAGEKESEILKKKPKSLNCRPKLRLYGPYDLPGNDHEDEDEIFSFGSGSDEEDQIEAPIIEESPVDHDFNVALSLQFDSENVSHKLSKSREIKSPTAWPSLQTPPKPAVPVIAPSGPVSWPSLSPAPASQPKSASPWGVKPATASPWGSQNLAQKLQALKTEK